ncbi:hypothetical protein C2R22_12140 [Salinigranum rubrum]|uniref:Carboxypeptidase regulatory-like domain-containing protein n=1 Tax=Salinigranum rubrum TaxID=755307 RepID=A0A2I8VK43_9EURY|nr:carboxypeptidase regulatory-like domain-containing protein [Salinigranum rubrum]AUV82300.1 hypothetical protein C2R22_12140 [Salinigranum rubrum]
MQRNALIVAGLVVVASLAGAPGTALAQSDDELVTLTIEVVNPSSNQRLGGVTLVATWNGGEERVTTASNGQALIDVPEAATVEITTDDDQYTRNEPYRIRVATERSHTIEVSRKADLDVVVNDAEGPVANARVTLSQDGVEVVSGRTDSDGLYQSGTVAQGEYTLAVVKPGYYRTTQDIVVAGSPERTVSIERGRVDYDVVVEDPHFDPARPVADATVSVQGVGEVQTDDNGAATQLLPVNSRLEVTVSKEGYETATETVTTNESESSLVFELSREATLSLTPVNTRVVVGEVVPVEVTNAYGEPASGVTVRLDGEAVARTDENGRATVRIESGGEHELTARGGGATSEAVTVRGVGEGGETATAETQETTEPETTRATTAPAGDSGPSPLTTFGPLVVVVLLIAVGAAYLYRRRRDDAPNPWADDEEEEEPEADDDDEMW